MVETRRETGGGRAGAGSRCLGPVSRLMIPCYGTCPPLGQVLSSSGSGGAPVTRPDGHPDGFCQEQDGGLMHSYWRLAVALLTIGELSELGAVDGPQLELRFKAAQPPPTRPCPSVRAGRPNPCGQDPRLLERARHDETEQQVSLPDLASRVHARLQRPRAGGLPMPCIIPRPRPRPRRRPRCCRCPRASPGPAEKP